MDGVTHNLGVPVQMGMPKQTPAEQPETAAMKSRLLAHAERRWQDAKLAHVKIEKELLNAMRRRNGIYDDNKLAQIRKQGGSTVYMQLTGIKVRAAAAWIKNVMLQSGERVFSVTPTPVSDRKEMMKQMAQQQEAILQQQGYDVTAKELLADATKMLAEQTKEAADKMEQQIDDQLIEGGFYEAMYEFIEDLCTFKSAFLKGPIVRKKLKTKWVQGQAGWELQKEPVYAMEWERVSPFDIFPAPDSKNINDSWLIERHHLSRRDLREMIGVPSYDEDAIARVLHEYKEGHEEYVTGDNVRDRMQTDTNNQAYSGDSIDGYELSDTISGETLLEWDAGRGVLPNAGEISRDEEYEVNVWVIGRHVIRVDINDDPSLAKPYYSASYDSLPGSFWGNSIPDIMADIQDVCNGCARSLVNNMAISSGPQTWSYADRMPAGEDISSMYPWKHWQFISDGGQGLPMGFFQPDSNAPELMRVYEYFSSKADEYTGIPAYTYGQSDKTGAGATASGLSMLMSSASNGIKAVIGHIDRQVIEPAIKRMYDFNMMHNPDESMKGDAQVISRGASSLIVKEQQQQKRVEFMQATMNDIDMQIMGVEGRAELLRETVKANDLSSDLIPDKQAMADKVQQMQQQAQQ